MRRQKPALADAIGTDSFLDIVANLVGILLIFLTVIGVRMEYASNTAKPPPPDPRMLASQAIAANPLPQMPDALALAKVDVVDPTNARLELSKLKSGIRNADAEAIELAEQMRMQKLDRDNLMFAITSAQQKLDQRRASLGTADQEKVQLDLELQQSEREFENVRQQLTAAREASAKPQTEILEHVATPIAKTVFVREEHFQLKDGRLLYVPLNELTNQLREDAPKKIWKLKTSRETTETLGPRDGFEMRYTLRRNRVPLQTESGLSAVRELVELDRFMMVPVGQARGETVEQALSTTSAFRSRISAFSPRETIITVWTYPDSFGAFRVLKSELYKLGFLTAARPLPKGQLISGSPQGTRSAAQ